MVSYLLVAPLTIKEYSTHLNAIYFQLKHPPVYISESPRRNRIMVFPNHLASEITRNISSTMLGVNRQWDSHYGFDRTERTLIQATAYLAT